MKTECSIVRDLLPLYLEDMVSPETAQYVADHLADCEVCRGELDSLKEVSPVEILENQDSAAPFQNFMKRMNRQFHSFAYLLIIFFIFLGYSWTGGENLMYNSLIMPVVGIFGYYVFRWKAVYKVPVLLLIMDLFVCLFRLAELDLPSALWWTFVYCLFVFVGIAIAFLLHYAFRKEKSE